MIGLSLDACRPACARLSATKAVGVTTWFTFYMPDGTTKPEEYRDVFPTELAPERGICANAVGLSWREIFLRSSLWNVPNASACCAAAHFAHPNVQIGF